MKNGSWVDVGGQVNGSSLRSRRSPPLNGGWPLTPPLEGVKCRRSIAFRRKASLGRIRVAILSRGRDSPYLGLVEFVARQLAIAGRESAERQEVSEASRTSGRRGEYPPRIRVGRRSGQRRRETPCPLVAPGSALSPFGLKSRRAYPSLTRLRGTVGAGMGS